MNRFRKLQCSCLPCGLRFILSVGFIAANASRVNHEASLSRRRFAYCRYAVGADVSEAVDLATDLGKARMRPHLGLVQLSVPRMRGLTAARGPALCSNVE